VKVAVNVVEFVTLTELAVIFPPLTETVVAPGTKFVPVSVSDTVAPAFALHVLNAVNVGGWASCSVEEADETPVAEAVIVGDVASDAVYPSVSPLVGCVRLDCDRFEFPDVSEFASVTVRGAPLTFT
jgi:hypothetical protein